MRNPFNINIQYLKHNFRQSKAYFIVYSVLLFTTFPLYLIILKVNEGFTSPNLYTNLELYNSLSMVTLALFLAVITPLVVFNYLNNKKAVDVHHSLPIRRESILATNVLFSYILVAIPYLINFGLAFLLAALFNYKVDPDLYTFMVYSVVLLGIAQVIPLIVIMNTGATSETVIHTAILLVIPFLAFVALNLFTSTHLYGLKSIEPTYLKYLTPLAAIYVAYDNIASSELLVNTAYWAVLYLLSYAFATYLYRRRKSENSEVPFVNDIYFPAVTTVFIIILFLIINIGIGSIQTYGTLGFSFFNIDSFIMAVGITFSIYAVLNFFRYRSTKYILKSTLNYLGIITLTSIVSLVLIQTQLFGYVWKLPNHSKVESVSINTSQLSDAHSILNPNTYLYGGYLFDTTLNSKESVDLIYNFHRNTNDILKTQKNFIRTGDVEGLDINPIQTYRFAHENISTVALTYNLSNGRKFTRELSIPTEMVLPLAGLLKNEDYQKIINPILNEEAPLTPRFTLYNETMSLSTKVLNTEFIPLFQEAYFKDLEKISTHNLVYQGSELKYIFYYELDSNAELDKNTIYTNGVDWNKWQREYRYGFDNYMFIDSRFENTLKLIENFGPLTVKEDNYYQLVKKPSTEKGYILSAYGTISVDRVYYDEYYYENDNSSFDINTFNGVIEGSHIRTQKGETLVINDRVSLPIKP